MKTIIPILMIVSLLFNGCSQKAPDLSYLEIDKKYPKLITLYSVESVEIKDFSSLDDKYYSVNKTELHKASYVSKKLRKNIKFYEIQNYKINKIFHEGK